MYDVTYRGVDRRVARARARNRALRRERRNNVNDIERLASTVAGAALTAYAIRRRGLGGALLAIAGIGLVERGLTGHCRVYNRLGVSSDNAKGWRLEKRHGPNAVLDASRAIRVEQSITIDRPATELYAYWRNLENLAVIMPHVEDIHVMSDTRSRWRVRGPAGQHLEWEAEIINDIPGELLAWKSVDDATVPHAGSVHFDANPSGRGTDVRVLFEYDPPAHILGDMVARLSSESPERRLREDLRRFKVAAEENHF